MFEEVYRRFRVPVWRLARRLTEGEEEALADLSIGEPSGNEPQNFQFARAELGH